MLPGAPGGLDETAQRSRTQNSKGLDDSTELDDRFGQTLIVGDFDGDGFMDVAVGVPFENVSGAADAGGVNVIFGDADGFDSTGDLFLTQATMGVPNQPQFSDHFGGLRVHQLD